jgi:PIN domain nuclease of toxin-antitoxin system
LNLLLDTHVAIWAVSDSARLSERIVNVLTAPDNKLFVSTISLIEIAIKWSGNRSDRPPFDSATAGALFAQAGMTLVNFDAAVLPVLERLPWHHRDPFDRLLIAQADHQPFRLVTADRLLERYAIPIEWV